MKRRLLPMLAFALIAMLFSHPALADTVNIGFVSYDVTGTNIA